MRSGDTRLPGNAPRVPGFDEFAAESLKFITHMSSADAATIHLFDQTGQRVWLGSLGVPARFRAAYYDDQMWRIDPLGAIRAGGGEHALVDLQTAEGQCQRAQKDRYRDFLGSFDIIDAAEMVFRHGEELTGGMSLLWTRAAPRTLPSELEALTHLHHYIQLNFHTALRGTVIGWRKSLVREFSLTSREMEVVELVCASRTNCEIAEALGISLATVKSHLASVFQKLGVRNRAGLVQRTLTSASLTRH